MNKILNPNSSARNSRAFAAWGALTINLIHSYDPEIIIFGGGLKVRTCYCTCSAKHC
jgi:hypothetical protein